MQLVDRATGAVADPVLVDRVTGPPITEADHVRGRPGCRTTRRRSRAPARSAMQSAPVAAPAKDIA